MRLLSPIVDAALHVTLIATGASDLNVSTHVADLMFLMLTFALLNYKN